jgi:hypothetical protein
MQPNEIVSLFSNIKAVTQQTDVGPLTDQTLAILAVGCMLENQLATIARELEDMRIRL